MFNNLLENLMFVDLEESLSSAKKLYLDTDKISKEDFDNLLELDPTKNKKYIEWMVKNFIKEKELDKFKLVKEFDKLVTKGLIKKSDINSYKNTEELFDEIKKYEEIKTKGEEKKDIKMEGSEKVFENDNVIILHIINMEASCYYGKGTKWCISAETVNYFKQYSKKGIDFYFVLNKKLKQDNPKYKIAIAISSDKIFEIYDATDKLLNTEETLKYLESLGINLDILKYNWKFNIEFYITGTYKKNNDGSYGVDGSVDFSNKEFKKLPVKFNKVTGDFYCQDSQLTSLEGSPKEVGGGFDCHDNQLTSLEGSPKEVGGGFDCHDNQLTSLEGSPKEVGGSFYCHNNQLTSLEGSPQKVGRDFFCYNNQLTSLEGSPKEVGGHFNCHDNQLTSLEGSPKEVGGHFNCHDNQLTSLEGSPQKVGGGFYCHNNQLTSLEGSPQKVGRDFNCMENTKKFTREEVLALCRVGGEIYV